MDISIFPRFLVNKLSNNSLQQINWNILLSSVLIILFFVIGTAATTVDSLPHVCVFKVLFGIPCPGCGVFRSIQCIFDFRIVDSIKYNPNGILIVSSIILQIPLRVLAIINENHIKIVNCISLIMTRLILISIFISWIILVLTLKF